MPTAFTNWLKRVNWRSVAMFLTSAAGIALVHSLVPNEQVADKIAAAVGIIAGIILSQTDPIVRTAKRADDPPGTIPTPSGPVAPEPPAPPVP